MKCSKAEISQLGKRVEKIEYVYLHIYEILQLGALPGIFSV